MEKAQIEKAEEFILARLRDSFSLDELARFVGYSAYHFAREFKADTGKTVMEYTRERRLNAAAQELAEGKSVMETALSFGFDTHAGFTKAFGALFGCPPTEYAAHKNKKWKGLGLMEVSKIKVRLICTDDVQDLWENVYSAMTPRQITEDKILPQIAAQKNGTGLELVAEVDGRVVMTLPVKKPFWLPFAVIFDNNFTPDGGDADALMSALLTELKRHCKRMNITALIVPAYENDSGEYAFERFGFAVAFKAGGWVYQMAEV